MLNYRIDAGRTLEGYVRSQYYLCRLLNPRGIGSSLVVRFGVPRAMGSIEILSAVLSFDRQYVPPLDEYQ